MDRASGSGPEGRGFESLHVRYLFKCDTVEDADFLIIEVKQNPDGKKIHDRAG